MITEQTSSHHMPQTQGFDMIHTPASNEAWEQFFRLILVEYDALLERRRECAQLRSTPFTSEQTQTK